jgi:very-short-patch-repair endonuclease
MPGPRDLLKKLFGYIEEQLKDVDPRGFHLSKLSGFKLNPDDLRYLPGIELDIKTEGDHIWLKVERLEAIQPPQITDKSVHGLINFSSQPAGAAPTLDETAIQHKIASLVSSQASIQERQEAEQEFRAKATEYLKAYTPQWQNWAHTESLRRKTISLYSDLFSLIRVISSNETSKPIEFVCGLGVAAWSMKSEVGTVDFQYPLLNHTLEIGLNSSNMALEVRPRAVETSAELHGLIACGVEGAAEVEKQVRDLMAARKDRPITPFDTSSCQDVLKLIARTLDSKGVYVERGDTNEYPSAGENLTVTETWLLYTRAKNNNFLVEDLRRLQENLDSGIDIPGGPMALVSPPSDEVVKYEAVNFRGISSRGDSSSTPQELYFPLPYNQEQVTIIQRLEKSNGVTVQGPPGTGKTHTIANIICHYLASGKRILVTSRGEQALKVLQSKVPEELQPLTVALLTNDREGIRQFQGSIEAIQHQVSQLNPEQAQIDIESLNQSIERTHSELINIDRRVDEIAATQLSETMVDGQLMRAKKMAELVVSGQEKYGWFDDPLSLDETHKPVLTEEEATELRRARRTLQGRLVYVTAKVPQAETLPTISEIVELHGVLSKIKEIAGLEESGRLLPLKAITRENYEKAQSLVGLVDTALEIVRETETTDSEWRQTLRVNLRKKDNVSEIAALEALFSEIEQIVEARAQFLQKPVDLPAELMVSLKVKNAVNNGASKGKATGLFTSSDLKKQLGDIKVNGLVPGSKDDWIQVQKFLALGERLISFSTRWNRFSQVLAMPLIGQDINDLRTIEKIALGAKQTHELCLNLEVAMVKLAEEVFQEPPHELLLGNSSHLGQVKQHLQSHITKNKLVHASSQLVSLQEKLANCTGPITDKLRKFIADDLGNETLESTRIASAYGELLEELRSIAGLSQEIAVVQDLTDRIAENGAPKFAHRLCNQVVSGTGEDRAFPADWRQAWTWSRLRSHLESIEARKELVEMAQRRAMLEVGLSRLYKEVVAKHAWLSTKRNATPKVLQALAGYAVAIRRIGQGTGPNAFRYRRDAQSAMLEAAGAVPCWIMSHAKISESMPSNIGAFDLVIVDEASQSDLWALPAIVRGKKILVVGDDKQVSPDGGFISSGKIDDLKTRFLSDQPFKEEMTPEKSLYDLAARVFAAQQVMLREHFRCVQPIISYSNRVFYRDAIQPLRIPKASERIDPPLVDILVEGGIRDKQDRNHAEAEAITQEIGALLNDPQYVGRTIGVVSLLGFDQAKLIDSMVHGQFDAGELFKREFECGDARTFQGSERDIIFLSMVVDRTSARAASGNMFEQRYNVAASRARDRMYLVRSVKANELSDKDLRLTLLQHFEQPILVDQEANGQLIGLCESEFEKEVFTKLTDKGYKVIPQVKSGAYRIDMVVEGAGDTRLAIELDGDEYHGPDRWQHDMQRQRVLERAGWTFWRCFASTWSLRKDEIFDELIEHLTDLQIHPIGSVDTIPSLVDKRIWRRELISTERQE